MCAYLKTIKNVLLPKAYSKIDAKENTNLYHALKKDLSDRVKITNERLVLVRIGISDTLYMGSNKHLYINQDGRYRQEEIPEKMTSLQKEAYSISTGGSKLKKQLSKLKELIENSNLSTKEK